MMSKIAAIEACIVDVALLGCKSLRCRCGDPKFRHQLLDHVGLIHIGLFGGATESSADRAG